MVGENKIVKYKDLLISWPIINKIMKLEIPFKVQYWLNKNIHSIQNSIDPLEKRKIELIKQYGVKDIEKNIYTAPVANEEFNKKWEELAETEVEIFINPIEIKLFENIKINRNEIKAIEYMICEDKIIKVFQS
jgi:hypothetical protein